MIHTKYKKRKDLVKMERKWIIFTIIVMLLGGILIGIFFAMNGGVEDEKLGENPVLNQMEENKEEENILQTASVEEKLSPNAMMEKRIYYRSCDHLMSDTEKVDERDVNKTKQEMEIQYTDWKLEKFTKDEISLYQEVDETCPQHFKLIDEDGVIHIYQANKNGKYEKVDETDISTMYLSEEDQAELKKGISIVGEDNLNSTLEDFE